MGELVLAHPGSPGQRAVKRLTVVPMMKLTWTDYTFVLPSVMSLPLTISCFSKIQIGFTFLVPAHPGSPGQGAVKRLCVYVCVFYITLLLPVSENSSQREVSRYIQNAGPNLKPYLHVHTILISSFVRVKVCIFSEHITEVVRQQTIHTPVHKTANL